MPCWACWAFVLFWTLRSNRLVFPCLAGLFQLSALDSSLCWVSCAIVIFWPFFFIFLAGFLPFTPPCGLYPFCYFLVPTSESYRCSKLGGWLAFPPVLHTKHQNAIFLKNHINSTRAPSGRCDSSLEWKNWAHWHQCIGFFVWGGSLISKKYAKFRIFTYRVDYLNLFRHTARTCHYAHYFALNFRMLIYLKTLRMRRRFSDLNLEVTEREYVLW